ncbi:hypothetical protein D3C73_713730 [compost metagenome]
MVISTTPLAPSAPYTAVAEASLSTEKVSISSTGMLLISDLLRGTPSIIISGLVPPAKELTPRIQKFESSYPGSPEGCIATMPGTCPAMELDNERPVTARSLAVMVLIEATRLSFFCLPKPTTTTSSKLDALSVKRMLTVFSSGFRICSSVMYPI